MIYITNKFLYLHIFLSTFNLCKCYLSRYIFRVQYLALKTKSEYAFLGKAFIFKKNKLNIYPEKFVLNKEYSNDESGIYVNELL